MKQTSTKIKSEKVETQKNIAKGQKKIRNARDSNCEKQMDEMRANKDDIQDS
jgi:hypothetical protein